jgi:hypothetical protein
MISLNRNILKVSSIKIRINMLSGSDIRWARKYRSSPYPLHEGDSELPILLLGLYVPFSDYAVKRYAVSRSRENQRGWMRYNILLNNAFTGLLYRIHVI